MEATIRPATAADLSRINEIYNTYIVDSHVSFDTEPWTDERRAEWWRHYQGRVLVAVDGAGTVVGTAFAGPWRHKEAYRDSVETTIVLDAAATGRGLGSRLLDALLAQLTVEGLHRAYAIIALPNEASIALHRRLGYREVGVLDEVGRKLGSYWSTMIMERRL
jgi:phosphinothricin acetyltransferase